MPVLIGLAQLLLGAALSGGLTDGGNNCTRVMAELIVRQDGYSVSEPVIVEVTVENPSETAVAIDLGPWGQRYYEIALRDPAGREHVRRLERPLDNFSEVGVIELAPGERYVDTVVVDQWHELVEAGEYEIELSLAGDCGFVTLPARLEVTPRRAERVASTCEKLASMVLQGTRSELRAGALALRFAQDEACVPALVSVAKSSFYAREDAVQGLAGTDSPEVVRAVVSAWGDFETRTRALIEREFASVGRREELAAALRAEGYELED